MSDITKITIEAVSEDKDKVVITSSDKKRYKFFKTEWDKANDKPGTVESKPWKQYQHIKPYKGTVLDLDVFESKEKSFVNEKGETIKYHDRYINEFLHETPALNPNGTYAPGQTITLDEPPF